VIDDNVINLPRGMNTLYAGGFKQLIIDKRQLTTNAKEEGV
jgi:hypothetical protein